MIVFYQEPTKVKQLVTTGCDSDCAINCLKPKKKCCHKYKKKGINCKRCPLVLLEKAS